MPPPAAAALMEELIEEILLRFPPHDPALLVRAALVCKQWCRLVSGAGFRRRFLEFHRAPPMLGFLYSSLSYTSGSMTRFVRTAASCPPIAFRRHSWVLDARHGRVLLLQRAVSENVLVVWDPIADEQRELPFPKPMQSLHSWNAAVLCAAHGSCDRRRSFLVVFVCNHTSTSSETNICTYSSDTATWSDQIFTHQQPSGCVVPLKPKALVGNSLYFGLLGEKKHDSKV